MNKESMLFDLREASQAIDELIASLLSDDEYDYPEVLFDFQHIYHRINTAWNNRNDDADDLPFNTARQFPTDIDMGSDVE